MSLNISDFKSLVDDVGLAKANKYKVVLPVIGILDDIDGPELNFLCDTVNLPGKQILTNERQIGIKFDKMVNGYAVDDISLTFYLTNNYNVKRYFESWAEKSVAYNIQQVKYKNTYERDFRIFQLDDEGNEIYGCKIIEAFPTTLNPVEMGNIVQDIARYNVQISYTDWEPIPQNELKQIEASFV